MTVSASDCVCNMFYPRIATKMFKKIDKEKERSYMNATGHATTERLYKCPRACSKREGEKWAIRCKTCVTSTSQKIGHLSQFIDWCAGALVGIC